MQRTPNRIKNAARRAAKKAQQGDTRNAARLTRTVARQHKAHARTVEVTA